MRLNKARTLLHRIVAHAQNDPHYMDKLRNNPVEVLVKEGLPYDVIEDFIREAGWTAEVSGFGAPACANTCALTAQSPL